MITLQEIKEITESITNIEDIGNKSRARHITEARWIYCRLAKDYTNFVLSEIGKPINRDHSTVLHSLKQYKIFESNLDNYTDEIETARDIIEIRLSVIKGEKIEYESPLSRRFRVLEEVVNALVNNLDVQFETVAS